MVTMETQSVITEFTKEYLAAGLWCDADNCLGNKHNKKFTLSDISPVSMKKAEIICKRFLDDNPESLQFSISTVSADLWFSQNGHGTGFWDREEIYGVELAKKFHKYTKEKMVSKDFTYYKGKLFLE